MQYFPKALSHFPPNIVFTLTREFNIDGLYVVSMWNALFMPVGYARVRTRRYTIEKREARGISWFNR